jgi:SPP1 gp7 family putative phage head morphogenesis protein
VAWNVDGNAVDPAEAIAWFRARLLLSDTEFAQLSDEARRRAFAMAGLSQLELVQQVVNGLESALANGDTFEEFKASLPARLQNAWGGQSAYRLRLAFDTELQKAYGAGRWKSADEVRESRPFWGLAVVLDGRTSQICSNLRGVVRPADDPFWNTHIPPLHFRCRTALITLSREQAEARGITSNAPNQPPLEGFGAPPGRQAWSPNEADYHPELWSAYQRSQQPDFRPTPARPDAVPVNNNPVTIPAARVPDVMSQRTYGQPRQFDYDQPEAALDVIRQLEVAQPDLRGILGLQRPVMLEDFLDAAGVPNGSLLESVELRRFDRDYEFRVFAKNDALGITSQFRILRMPAEGEPYISNELFFLREDAQRGSVGLRMFAHQAKRAQELGFKYVTCSAVRSDSMNGYFTWPRMGFNAPLTGSILSRVQQAYLQKTGQPLDPRITDLHRLFLSREGRDVWSAVGRSIKVKFDLDPKSPHWRFLRQYMGEKNVDWAADW